MRVDMPSSDSLRTLLHQRLIEAFGEPDRRAGGGAHWSLRARDENSATVNLIATGTEPPLGLWVFDPADPVTGMQCTSIHSALDIKVVIEGICERLHWSYADTKNGCAVREDARDRASK